MNIRKFASWVIFCLTVLAAELIAEMAMHTIGNYMQEASPYKKTAIQMLVAIVVFFPVFQLIDSFVKKSYLNSATTKKDFFLLLFSFFIGLCIIYGVYLKVKFNISIFDQFSN
jgi:uncharacterized membrane protein